jgi:hypothetical protein
MFKFMWHIFAQSRLVWVGFVSFDDPYVTRVRILGLSSTWITCLSNSRNQIDLGCVLRVWACQILYKSWKNWVSCGRCRFLGCFGANHPVDYISIQSDRFIFFGNVCSFFMDPDSAVQPYSVMLSWVKHVYKLCFKYCMLLAFHI